MTALLVFDGDCGFCTSAAAWITRHADVETVPWQFAELDALGLSLEQVQTAVWLVDDAAPAGSAPPSAAPPSAAPPSAAPPSAAPPSAAPRGGAAAIAAALRRAHLRRWRAVGAVLQWPGVRLLARVGYRVIARNRRLLPGATAACALPSR
ncbi:thiol-disulfide oxidoreductase DCC family protein [Microbacterium sp.]|uniref:thiol-disulfide oxidoreductase DCC family protein n=1 Tax=Microbacterium sp. TaxID=51671 RepID=UPI0039E47559